MPAKFQKAMDHTLAVFKNIFCFPDDNLTVSKGSEDKHFLTDCNEKRDADNLRINLPKGHFTKSPTVNSLNRQLY